MLKAVIIEDELLSAEKLSFLLDKSNRDIEVQTILSSVSASVEWLSVNTVDLIFMDIHLTDGKAFDIFKKIEIRTPIIFTTAYDQYTLEAFREFGIDYLMKPIIAKDLERALKKFEQLRRNTFDEKVMDNLMSRLQDEGQKKLLVNAGKEIKIIEVEDIACFYSEDKSVYLLTLEGRKFLLDHTLEKITGMVPKFFFRANRKVVVNLNRVSRIENHTYGRLLIAIDPAPHFDIIVPLERVNRFKTSIVNNK